MIVFELVVSEIGNLGEVFGGVKIIKIGFHNFGSECTQLNQQYMNWRMNWIR